MKRKHEEHDMQADFFRACEYISECQWMYAIPNAMPGGVRAQVWMNAEGRKKGVSDIFLPCFVSSFLNGLYLEAKMPGKKLTKEQAEFIIYADQAGYGVSIFRSVQEGVGIVQKYLKGFHNNKPAIAEARKKLGLE